MTDVLSESLTFCYDHIFDAKSAVPGLFNAYDEIETYIYHSEVEGKFSEPMVFIGIYIAIASLIGSLAMELDLWYAIQSKKFWYPNKYFSLNAASMTVIAVAMKLPLDLNSAMPREVDKIAKFVSLPFMCIMMSNFIPSLASMDNNSLVANVIALSIFIITLIVNVGIQIKTGLIRPMVYMFSQPYGFTKVAPSMVMATYIYIVLLLFLLIIFISSAITIPALKKIIEHKYQASSKRAFDDLNPPNNQIPTDEKLRQFVKRYWIMAETGSPQFLMARNSMSYASGFICSISFLLYQVVLLGTFVPDISVPVSSIVSKNSVYKWSMPAIFFIQSIGISVGSTASLLRCSTALWLTPFDKQINSVCIVETYWTQKLDEWKESGVSFLSSGCRSRVLLYNTKSCILSFCIAFQKAIVVLCKVIALLVPVFFIFYIYFTRYFISVGISTTSSSNDANEDLNNYVLLLEDDMQVSNIILKVISDSMDRLIQKAEKKQHKNLLKLIVEYGSVSLDGVKKFDTDQIQYPLPVELVNSWSLPVISLTCIAIVIPNIDQDKVNNLLKSVGEGLLYTHLVEENLNRDSMSLKIRRATDILWHEVEGSRKWLEDTLERSAYEGKTPIEIINSFADKAAGIFNECSTSTHRELAEGPKVIAAKSMYRIAKTIMHTYPHNTSHVIEEELFAHLANMIADILSACLTNIPQLVTMKCQENAIENRETGAVAAIELLGRTTKIIKRLERCIVPDEDKRAFIDEWRRFGRP